MDITEKRDGDISVVSLAGRLDVLTSKDLGSRLSETIESGARRLVIDLSGLEYVSSAGLRVLLQARKTLKPEGGVVMLCGAGEFVNDVLQTTGFTSIFPCQPNVDLAIQHLQSADSSSQL